LTTISARITPSAASTIATESDIRRNAHRCEVLGETTLPNGADAAWGMREAAAVSARCGPDRAVPCIRLTMILAVLLTTSVMKSRTTATPKSAW
jgi:hypothetical protein